MNLAKNQLNIYKIIELILKNNYSTKNNGSGAIYKEINYKISPYSTIEIYSPFNLHIKQSDTGNRNVENNDEIKIKFLSNIPKNYSNIECKIDEKYVKIIGKLDHNLKLHQIPQDTDVTQAKCMIEIPLKSDITANLYEKANYSMDGFLNDFTKITTDGGHIVILNKIETKELNLNSAGGNIISNGLIQADNILISTINQGNIVTDRVLGNSLNILNEDGVVRTNSCYVNQSKIISKNGSLNLKNIHKMCEIHGSKLKSFNLDGFDGDLNANIIGCDKLQIQISKLTNNSQIDVKERANIRLKLSKLVQDTCDIFCKCQRLLVSTEITGNMQFGSLDTNLFFVKTLTNEPNDKPPFVLNVNCENSDVSIENESWLDNVLSNK